MATYLRSLIDFNVPSTYVAGIGTHVILPSQINTIDLTGSSGIDTSASMPNLLNDSTLKIGILGNKSAPMTLEADTNINANRTFTTPSAVDLSSYNTLEFYYTKGGGDWGGEPDQDQSDFPENLLLQYSLNGVSSWITITEVTPNEASDTLWQRELATVPLSAKSSPVFLRFAMNNVIPGSSASNDHWAVSNISGEYISATGETGYQGSEGYKGSAGYQGSLGFTGSTGEVGFRGSAGYTGSRGNFGPTGFTGSVGYLGSSGRDGYDGSFGYTGSNGYTGSAGISGNQGSTGYDGSQGLDGYVGSRGFVGSTGAGYTGSTGYVGSKGDKGDPDGYTGSMGAAGRPSLSQKFVANGVSSYSLSEMIQQPEHILVSVNGLLQLPTTDYTVSYDTINFIQIPIPGSDVEIRFFGEEIGAPGYRGSTGYRGSSGLCKVIIASTAPSSPEEGQLWWDTDNGILNIFYTDENTWVGIAEGPEGPKGYSGSYGYTGSIGFTGSGYAGSSGYDGSRGDLGYTGSIGYSGSAGALGYAGSQGAGYTGSASTEPGYSGSVGFVGSKGFTGSIGVGYTGSHGITINEPYLTYTASTSMLSLDCTQTRVFYINPQNNFDINLINLNLPADSVTNIVLMINQGATARVPNVLQIGGSSKTIKWQGGTTPTPNANKTDMVSFSILYTGSNYLVFGQLIPFG